MPKNPKLVDPCPSDTGTPSPQGLTRLSVPMIVGPLYLVDDDQAVPKRLNAGDIRLAHQVDLTGTRTASLVPWALRHGARPGACVRPCGHGSEAK